MVGAYNSEVSVASRLAASGMQIGREPPMAARQPPPAVGPNDVLRFGLEIAALVALGYGGWIVGGGGVTGTGLAVALTAVLVARKGMLEKRGRGRCRNCRELRRPIASG